MRFFPPAALLLTAGLLRAGSAPNSLAAPSLAPGNTLPHGDPAYQWTQVACTDCSLNDAAPSADGGSVWLALTVSGANGAATQHRLRQVDREGRLLGERLLSLAGTGAIRRLLAVAETGKGPLVLFSDSLGAVFSGRPDGAGRLAVYAVAGAKQKAQVTRLFADGAKGFFFIGRRGNDGLAGRLDPDGRPLWMKAVRWNVEGKSAPREGLTDGWCDTGGNLHLAGESAASAATPGSLWLGTLDRDGELTLQSSLSGRPLAYAPGGAFAGVAAAGDESETGWHLLEVGATRAELLRSPLPDPPFSTARMAGMESDRWLLAGVSAGKGRAFILSERGVPVWDHRPNLTRTFAAIPVPLYHGFFLVFEYEIRLADGTMIHQVDLRRVWERGY